jgi:DNA-binding XRE family transcriptional regulator
MPNISFGERVRRARIRNAMTQADLAEKIEVVQTTISNWEKEKATPNPDQKIQLKKVLGSVWTETSTDREEDASAVSVQPGAHGREARPNRQISITFAPFALLEDQGLLEALRKLSRKPVRYGLFPFLV